MSSWVCLPCNTYNINTWEDNNQLQNHKDMKRQPSKFIKTWEDNNHIKNNLLHKVSNEKTEKNTNTNSASNHEEELWSGF